MPRSMAGRESPMFYHMTPAGYLRSATIEHGEASQAARPHIIVLGQCPNCPCDLLLCLAVGSLVHTKWNAMSRGFFSVC